VRGHLDTTTRNKIPGARGFPEIGAGLNNPTTVAVTQGLVGSLRIRVGAPILHPSGFGADADY
jgi:hypothetical protein